MKYIFIKLVCLVFALVSYAHEPEFSIAGFFRLNGTGRDVYSMNPAWRFYKGSARGAETKVFDDSKWQVISLPHGIEYLPTEASGNINYQGEVWYRKHFVPSDSLKGKKIFLHFEAIMGKSKIYVNGLLLKEHFGGYLPISVELTHTLVWGEDNVIAVLADNSDDPSYPPGKPQDMLDFTYFGGIYRDCWMIAHHSVYITDPNYENEVAGGGLLVVTERLSDHSAELLMRLHTRNDTDRNFSGNIIYSLVDQNGVEVTSKCVPLNIRKKTSTSLQTGMSIKQPSLWTPSTPYLYHLLVRIYDKKGNVVDGYRRRIGIRTIDFRGKDGFWLNGKPYGKPLMGANRHQDFAVVGNAVSNSIHWRDAKKLKDIGLEVIRNAHYPQDPAFMDACDELGLFVIVNTPGWQFWNESPVFAERVYQDIRNTIRRDRNHPCVWLWEPVLNETSYPSDFARQAKMIAYEECPYSSFHSACDACNVGKEFYEVHFYQGLEPLPRDPGITYFKREWGDFPDDWNAQNSPSRVARNWGEQPMLVQATHYACSSYDYINWENLYHIFPRSVGGCLWHSFDHQRGYHSDPFYGGLMDAFRQPKYAYYMFMAQRSPQVLPGSLAETGPMVYVAHEMTPFSGRDVTVYSNCDEVRLTVNPEGKTYVYQKEKGRRGMPSPVIVFQDVFDLVKSKNPEACLLAEGIMEGKVVAIHKVTPARRAVQIRLRTDDEGVNLRADGSDIVTVIAEIVDKDGRVKRLNNQSVYFSIEGEGRILGGSEVMANPAPVKWGSAPILVQATTTPGKIKVKAGVFYKGSQMPVSAELELHSISPMYPLVFNAGEMAQIGQVETTPMFEKKIEFDPEKERLYHELNERKLKEVERQQTHFGEKRE